MESSFSDTSIVTVQELLRLRSPLSSHHHISSPKRKTSQPTFDDRTYFASTVDAGKAQSNGNLPQDVFSREKHVSESTIPLSKNPSWLLGWIQLLNDSLDEADWLAFSDHSGTIRCVLTDVNPQVLGCPVRLLSWSYIPDRHMGGCIEVRGFEKAETSISLSIRSCFRCPETANVPNLVLETPPSKRNRKSRFDLSGRVTFISSPFAMPHGESRTVLGGKGLKEQNVVASKESNSSSRLFLKEGRISWQSVLEIKDQNLGLRNVFTHTDPNKPLLGFFVELSACNHKPRCSSTRIEHCNVVNCAGCVHCQPTKQHLSYVYFSGSPAAWRPILLRVSGKCISISGLRKKVLLVGEEQTQYCVYAATRTCGVAQCITADMLVLKTRVDHFTKSLCFMETHQQQKRVGHVGSYVGVVSEIFLRGGLLELDGCIWLLLTHQPLSQVPGLRVGAMVAAHHVHFLKVKSFFENAMLLGSCSRTHVVVTHFSPLHTVYAGKRELRSRLSRFLEHLPFLPAFWALQAIASFKQKFRGMFSEKEILGSGKNTGLVEAYLRRLLGSRYAKPRNVLEEFFSHSNACTLAECVSSHFSLQYSPACGKLQLVDATGALDVVVPDLQTAECFRGICQVTSYKLVIEGYSPSTDVNTDARNLPMSSLNILKGTLFEMKDSDHFSLFLLFFIKEALFLQNIEHFNLVGKSLGKGDPHQMLPLFNLDKEDLWTLDVLFVLHTFPTNFKNFGKQTEGISSSFYVEAVKLPYSLCIFNGSSAIPPHEQTVLSPISVGLESSNICRAFLLSMSGQAHNVLKKAAHGSDDNSYSYSSYPSLLKKNASTMKRLLFQFHETHKQAFKIVEIGRCYLVKCFSDHAVMSVHTASQIWSLAIEVDCGGNGMVQKILFESGSLVDVVLKLPPNLQKKFDSAVEDARAYLSPALSVGEVLDLAKRLYNWEDSNQTGLLKGSLISLYGKVAESVDARQSLPYSVAWCDKNRFGSNVFIMKDLDNSLFLMACGDPDQQGVPVGFGPGAVIVIRRALLQLSEDGEVIVVCIPSTLIDVRFVGEDSFVSAEDNSRRKGKFRDHADIEITQGVATPIGTLALKDSMVSSLPKLFRVRCRVISIERLLIERDKVAESCLSSSEAGIYRVRHVSLTVDDGSGLASCRARDQAAAGLLNLPLWKGQHSASNVNALLDSICVVRELNTMTKKYGMILFHNVSHMADSFHECFVVQGGGDQALECSEKRFIYGIVQRACSAGPLEIVAEHCLSKDCIDESWKDPWKASNIMELQSFPCPILRARQVQVVDHEKQLAAMSEDLFKMLYNMEDGAI